MNTFPDHRSLYRLPWSLADNPIAWMEPTSACNIYCQGCYRTNVKNAHKPMEEVKRDLDVFERFRRFDGVSIAGGDPLLHPDILAIVEEVARRGYKPIVNTNGVALTDPLLAALKKAGVAGFTFHIDSRQGRPGWKGKSETDLNALRTEFAVRVARAGGIGCAFNATVYEDTLAEVPEVVAWARAHIDIVNGVVFIAFRQASGEMTEGLEFSVGGKNVSMDSLNYSRPTGSQRLDISSRDVVAKIRERFPDFSPAAYLNGTEKADSLKWLLTLYVGTREKVYGYMGPRFMELSQNWHHLRHGRYLAYARRNVLRHGRSISLLAGVLDRGSRGPLARYLGSVLTRPLRPFPRLYLQSVMVIQPVDALDDGRLNMCDACPDITVHEGELVWSCRLDEKIKHGGFVRAARKEAAPEPAGVPD
jgi:hypothetical protein